jgi:hypothetical protein
VLHQIDYTGLHLSNQQPPSEGPLRQSFYYQMNEAVLLTQQPNQSRPCRPALIAQQKGSVLFMVQNQAVIALTRFGSVARNPGQTTLDLKPNDI